MRKIPPAMDGRTLRLTKPFTEMLSFFGNPVRVLLIGLLCASWGFRMLPHVLADSSGDRSGTFQVLADGTQDLAALVGLFATDSVERYSVDYSRGYLSVAVATCSLLGIMGYVRALVKLTMGSKSCQDSAFPTAPVRAILGVAESDRLPKDEIFTITYISKTINKLGATVTFDVVKRLDHTLESFPAAKAIFDPPTDDHQRVSHRFFLITPKSSAPSHFRDNWRILSMIWGSLLLTAALTSFPVILVSHGWTWTRIMASFGMFLALAASSIMWGYVYTKEQKPSRITNLRIELDEFAIIRPAQQSHKLVVCDLQGVTGSFELVCRALSLFTAVAITLGYICQYVEIRKATTTQAAWWLGSQTALALARLIIWIWDPKFDDYTDFFTQDMPLYDLQNFHGQDFAIVLFSILGSYSNGSNLEFPKLLLDRLENEPILPMLEQAYSLASGEIPEAVKDKLLNQCTAIWRFPEVLFSKWLACRSGNIERMRNPSPQYSCLVVNIGGSEPWVGGEMMLIPVYYGPRWLQVASTSLGASGTIGYNWHLDVFRQIDDDMSDTLGPESPEMTLNILLEELSAAVTTMKKRPTQNGSKEKPTSATGGSTPKSESRGEIIIEMGNTGVAPPIQHTPLSSTPIQQTATSLSSQPAQ